MLQPKQLRKLGKGGYSDKQIINTAPGGFNDDTIIKGEGFWSNGTIILFEDAPKGAEPREADTSWVGAVAEKANVRVYPVEMVGFKDPKDNYRGCRMLKFSNGQGVEVWADPKYINSLIMTKRAKGEIAWYTSTVGTPCIKAVNGRTIGLVAAKLAPKVEPEWSFRYTGELPKGE